MDKQRTDNKYRQEYPAQPVGREEVEGNLEWIIFAEYICTGDEHLQYPNYENRNLDNFQRSLYFSTCQKVEF